MRSTRLCARYPSNPVEPSPPRDKGGGEGRAPLRLSPTSVLRHYWGALPPVVPRNREQGLPQGCAALSSTLVPPGGGLHWVGGVPSAKSRSPHIVQNAKPREMGESPWAGQRKKSHIRPWAYVDNTAGLSTRVGSAVGFVCQGIFVAYFEDMVEEKHINCHSNHC